MSADRLFSTKKKRAFLAHLQKTGNVTVSARVACVSRRWVYKKREEDEAFRQAWDEAVKASTDLMLEEARRRACDGIDEPVFYQGSVCGHVRRYSDTLLMFKIQGERPEYNRSRVNVEITGPGGGPVLLSPVLEAKLAEMYGRRNDPAIDVTPSQLPGNTSD